MPLNVFDAAGYRLGYGGGYFDRTLAALDPAPTCVGVAFELARPVHPPQPHDQPMDWIVTEAGPGASVGGGPERHRASGFSGRPAHACRGCRGWRADHVDGPLRGWVTRQASAMRPEGLRRCVEGAHGEQRLPPGSGHRRRRWAAR